jgi:hypothetical protein
LTDDWPFDADRDDPLAALRIPVVGSPYPRWKYEVCLVISSERVGDRELWGPSLRPDDREVQQLVAELDYRMAWYNPGWQKKMRERLLDVDSGTNTLILQKFAEADWRYRRMTFEHGMWPFYDMTERFTLEQLLDHVNDFGSSRNEKWHAHKARYAGVFTEVASA